MADEHGPFHRLGGPGGPGAAVTALQIEGKEADGTPVGASLLDAGEQSTEVELLRTVCEGLSVRWGQDEFGWWAVVPDRVIEAARNR